MKANQKYFPLLDAQGKLTNTFLIVSNIAPADPSAVIQGNERVVRPRLADAKFFFDQDRKKTLESRVPGLAKVVYHGKLGTQGERAERVRAIAHAIVNQWRMATVPFTAEDKDAFDVLDSKVQQAARLAKTDLLTDMVGEFPELQGIMGAYYARHEGLRDGVAIAIEDHYKPRFAGDALPRNHTGTVLALADKLETLVGLFGICLAPPRAGCDPHLDRQTAAAGLARSAGCRCAGLWCVDHRPQRRAADLLCRPIGGGLARPRLCGPRGGRGAGAQPQPAGRRATPLGSGARLRRPA
jgi:glycyl-tRNA synthetase beta subunit